MHWKHDIYDSRNNSIKLISSDNWEKLKLGQIVILNDKNDIKR